MSNWLPFMVALHHPAASNLGPDIFLRLQGRLLAWSEPAAQTTRSSHRTDCINVNFALTYTLLTKLESMSGNPRDLRAQIQAPFDEFFSMNLETVPGEYPLPCSGGGSLAILSIRQRVRGYGVFPTVFRLDQAAAVLLALLLDLPEHWRNWRHVGRLPIPAKMPFHSLMDLCSTVPYGSNPFSECHIRKMVTPRFLTGEWTGLFTNQPQSPTVGPHSVWRMHGIRIVARYATEKNYKQQEGRGNRHRSPEPWL